LRVFMLFGYREKRWPALEDEDFAGMLVQG
jgi:hypothetical protein